MIEREGHRLSEMVSQVLGFAGIGSARRNYACRPVDLAEVIENALEDCSSSIQEKGARVEKEVPSDLPQVMADAAALRRAFYNLLRNAIKYSEDSGWVAIRADAGSGDGHVTVRVEDRGHGIPKVNSIGSSNLFTVAAKQLKTRSRAAAWD